MQFATSSHQSVAAKHTPSGTVKKFDNVVDRSDYVTEEIRSSWEFFFVAPNGYEWGHETFK
jgi:hypothetical protein